MNPTPALTHVIGVHHTTKPLNPTPALAHVTGVHHTTDLSLCGWKAGNS